jgi:hypothetical protein
MSGRCCRAARGAVMCRRAGFQGAAPAQFPNWAWPIGVSVAPRSPA